jgi:hypothetical protein
MMQRTIPISCRPHLRWNLVAVAVLFMFVLAIASSRAQSNQGAILGTVKDPSGAIVSEARITLLNSDEGIVRETRSNTAGDFQFLDAKAGHYTITVTAKGFEKWSETKCCARCPSATPIQCHSSFGKRTAGGRR